jgi:hypothetical protein
VLFLLNKALTLVTTITSAMKPVMRMAVIRAGSCFFMVDLWLI